MPVGSFSRDRSSLGVCDLVGSVMEWVAAVKVPYSSRGPGALPAADGRGGLIADPTQLPLDKEGDFPCLMGAGWSDVLPGAGLANRLPSEAQDPRHFLTELSHWLGAGYIDNRAAQRSLTTEVRIAHVNQASPTVGFRLCIPAAQEGPTAPGDRTP
jgi:hypothetical protein